VTHTYPTRLLTRLMALVLTGVLVFAVTGVVVAQDTTDEAEEDELVTLHGVIVEHIDDNDYLFDDGEMQIVIDGGPHWYHQLDLPLNTEMSVTGTIGDGPPWLDEPRDPELDLHSYMVDGQTVEIRGEGRPPWAGGPKRLGIAVADDDDDDDIMPGWVQDFLDRRDDLPQWAQDAIDEWTADD
jgi:hypothetical protein